MEALHFATGEYQEVCCGNYRESEVLHLIRKFGRATDVEKRYKKYLSTFVVRPFFIKTKYEGDE